MIELIIAEPNCEGGVLFESKDDACNVGWNVWGGLEEVGSLDERDGGDKVDEEYFQLTGFHVTLGIQVGTQWVHSDGNFPINDFLNQ